MAESVPFTLLQGNYKASNNWYSLLEKEEDQAFLIESTGHKYEMTIRYGNLGEAHEEVTILAGQDSYNVEFSYSAAGDDFTELGVVTEDGSKAFMKGLLGISLLEWITPEEAAAILTEGEPIEAPVCPYELQPEKQGKLVWLTGPPCSGKSVMGQMLANEAGFVYYIESLCP